VKTALKKHCYSTAVAMKAGLRQAANPTKRRFRLVIEAIGVAGYKPGEQVAIAFGPGIE